LQKRAEETQLQVDLLKSWQQSEGGMLAIEMYKRGRQMGLILDSAFCQQKDRYQD
jgi:hypothetical protein